MYEYIYICIYVPYVHNSGVHGRLFGLDLKGNGHVGNNPWRSLDWLMILKMMQIRSPKGKRLDTHAIYMVNSCQG